MRLRLAKELANNKALALLQAEHRAADPLAVVVVNEYKEAVFSLDVRIRLSSNLCALNDLLRDFVIQFSCWVRFFIYRWCKIFVVPVRLAKWNLSE